MRKLVTSTRFRRDVKLARKRGKDIAKLEQVLSILTEAVLAGAIQGP